MWVRKNIALNGQVWFVNGSEAKDRQGMAQIELPEIPKRLQKYAERFDALRAKRKAPVEVTYQQLYAWGRNKKLSIADIGKNMGVSREAARQTFNNYLPGVRPTKARRWTTGRNSAKNRSNRKKQQRKRKIAAFTARNEMYRLLRAHCRNAGLKLELMWGATRPLWRQYLINGEHTYVLHVRSAWRAQDGQRYYAKSHTTPHPEFRRSRRLAVMIHMYDPVKAFALYIIDTETFLRKKLVYVDIPVTEPTGTPRECAINWANHHVSSLKRDPIAA